MVNLVISLYLIFFIDINSNFSNYNNLNINQSTRIFKQCLFKIFTSHKKHKIYVFVCVRCTSKINIFYMMILNIYFFNF